MSSTEVITTQSVVIGNCFIVESESTGNLMVYRQQQVGEGEVENVYIAAFQGDEVGVIISTLFCAYMAEMFPKGEINQQAVMERIIMDDKLSNPEALCTASFEGKAAARNIQKAEDESCNGCGNGKAIR